MHQIQKYILKVLIFQATARFSELRPPRTDSNLFSYHLKALVREGLLQKVSGGYTLTPQGLFMVDRISIEKLEPRLQPKLITMTVVLDDEGRVGLQLRKKQPFIGEWTLPSGKVHLDEPLETAVRRELEEKAGIHGATPWAIGDSYIHAHQSGVLISSVLAHVFVVRLEAHQSPETLTFFTADEAARLQLLPGVAALIGAALTATNERFFLELFEDR